MDFWTLLKRRGNNLTRRERVKSFKLDRDFFWSSQVLQLCLKNINEEKFKKITQWSFTVQVVQGNTLKSKCIKSIHVSKRMNIFEKVANTNLFSKIQANIKQEVLKLLEKKKICLQTIKNLLESLNSRTIHETLL